MWYILSIEMYISVIYLGKFLQTGEHERKSMLIILLIGKTFIYKEYKLGIEYRNKILIE